MLCYPSWYYTWCWANHVPHILLDICLEWHNLWSKYYSCIWTPVFYCIIGFYCTINKEHCQSALQPWTQPAVRHWCFSHQHHRAHECHCNGIVESHDNTGAKMSSSWKRPTSWGRPSPFTPFLSCFSQHPPISFYLPARNNCNSQHEWQL